MVGSWKDREEGHSSKSEPQDLSTCLCHADGRGGGRVYGWWFPRAAALLVHAVYFSLLVSFML